MSFPTVLEDFALKTRAELNKMYKKDDLLDSMIAMAQNTPPTPSPGSADKTSGAVAGQGQGQDLSLHFKLDLVLAGIDELRGETGKIKAENTALRSEVDTLKEIVSSHTRFLETVDEKSRQRNLIVFGVPDELEGEKEDEKKLEKIFEKLHCKDIATGFTFERFRKAGNGMTKPILVVLPDNKTRKKILQKKGQLVGGAYADIKLKRDQHAAIRREWSRLRKVFDDENAKPENQDRMEFDRKERVVKRDGQIIDSWKPIF